MSVSPTTVDLSVAGAPGADFDLGRPSRGFWTESVDRLRGNSVGVAAGVVIVVFGLIALFAPQVAHYLLHYDPNRQYLVDQFQGPTAKHLMGTDELGRDTMTRLVYGARVSYLVAFLSVAISLTIGTAVGIVAGYYGGTVDRLLMRFVDMLLSVPSLYLLILFSVIQPFGLTTSQPATLAVVIAILGWGGLARLVRGDVLGQRERDYVVATRSLGATGVHIMIRHILPNVAPLVIVVASLSVGGVILAEAALDFIGLGILPPTPSWGNMLTNAQSYFFHSITLVLAPGALIFIAVLSFNLFGNAVRDAFDPKLR